MSNSDMIPLTIVVAKQESTGISVPLIELPDGRLIQATTTYSSRAVLEKMYPGLTFREFPSDVINAVHTPDEVQTIGKLGTRRGKENDQ